MVTMSLVAKIRQHSTLCPASLEHFGAIIVRCFLRLNENFSSFYALLFWSHFLLPKATAGIQKTSILYVLPVILSSSLFCRIGRDLFFTLYSILVPFCYGDYLRTYVIFFPLCCTSILLSSFLEYRFIASDFLSSFLLDLVQFQTVAVEYIRKFRLFNMVSTWIPYISFLSDRSTLNP